MLTSRLRASMTKASWPHAPRLTTLQKKRISHQMRELLSSSPWAGAKTRKMDRSHWEIMPRKGQMRNTPQKSSSDTSSLLLLRNRSLARKVIETGSRQKKRTNWWISTVTSLPTTCCSLSETSFQTISNVSKLSVETWCQWKTRRADRSLAQSS